MFDILHNSTKWKAGVISVKEQFKEKTLEALSSVLPVTVIVLLLATFLVPMEIGTVALFLCGALLLVVGMGLFSLGTEMAMMPMGEGIGAQLSKVHKVWLVALVSLIMGIMITAAEPDLQVLAHQVPAIPNMTIVLTVSVGVGIFLVIAVLRTLFKMSLSRILIGFYILMFGLAAFVPPEFLAVAFDSGGVTTGPITVPFIMALGLGLASLRSDRDAIDDSFGLVAICSIGPILSVMILGIFYNPTGAVHEPLQIPHIETTRDLVNQFLDAMPLYIYEVFIAMVPLLAAFILLQVITKRFRQHQLIRMCIGFAYTFAGLVLFLTGVNVGFISVGHLLGSQLASLNVWLLLVIGVIVAYFIVAAEPAVYILNKQVEEVSNGAISRQVMLQTLSIGVAVSVGLALIRVITGISIFWLMIPGYVIALAMTFFVPKIFVGIAFDSGGVASGPMSTTFLLPLAMGACEALGGNVMTDAFGIVAMVAMTPLIAIQVLGIYYSRKEKHNALATSGGIIGDDFDDEDENTDHEVF